MNLQKAKKILIIRLSSLGDILLTTPLIRSIKQKYPQIEIEFLLRKEYVDTVKFNPYLSDIIPIPKNYDNQVIKKEIVSKRYDLIIDLQNNLRSRKLTNKLSAMIVRYKKPYLKRFLLVNVKINRYNKIVTIPERYAQTLPEFQLDGGRSELFLPDNIYPETEDNSSYIGFCPGSKHQTKMWPEEYFIELGNLLNQRNFIILLFGGKDDKQVCSKISSKINNSVDLSNDNDLLQLGLNMRKCRTIICNDSGLMHTAVSLGIPVISIFGSTVKEFGFFPYGGKNLVLEDNSLSCRPCSHIGKSKCPKGHLKCLKNIKPQFVFEETLNFIYSL